ncbi:methylenetetrahydrofolate reductase [Desulfurobacterium sp.]|uniref:methylenetetrahydrofolate reductase n=1 Tax=Desulfurobacterium sp. TaxID=2004706 RepID=UPI00260D6A4C|nr:methylenetetrahydrofolate reductase [Desulfurobacterium sp.]
MSFSEKINNGKFIITAEVAPPRGTDYRTIIEGIKPLKGYVDGFNVTDNQRSMVRASSIAMAKILLDSGFEPICQFTARDRNRIALQSDLLGAYMLGIRNICLMTGDFITLGDERGAKPVFDVDSLLMLKIVKILEEGHLINGKELKGKPSFNVGAVFNPFAGPEKLQIEKLKKKVELGAKFIQTQPVYDIETAKRTHEIIKETGAIPIIGLLPIKSLKMANFIKKLNPESVPDTFIEKLSKVKDPHAYGWEYTLEIAHGIAEFGKGIHFMLVGKTYELAKFIDYLKNESPYNHKF